MNKKMMSAALMTLMSCVMQHAVAKEELLELSARPDTKLKVLLTYEPDTKPNFVVINLPGGRGDFHFAAAPTGIQMINEARLPNKLRPLLLERGAASLTMDSPSDQLKMDDAFRKSDAHLTDLKAVLATAETRFPAVPVIVVGHSNGTMSATYLTAGAPSQVRATVLISGRLVWTEKFGDALNKFDWDKIRTPLLLLHHKNDDCYATPYSGSQALASRFELQTIAPEGELPTGGCTFAGTHNLVGQEKTVADAILAWARKQTAR